MREASGESPMTISHHQICESLRQLQWVQRTESLPPRGWGGREGGDCGMARAEGGRGGDSQPSTEEMINGVGNRLVGMKESER